MSKSQVRLQADARPVSHGIYVIGFPKSGTTWLVRFLADAFDIPVRMGGMGASAEMAAEVNRRVAISTDSPYRLYKSHYLPDIFLSRVDPNPKGIVYIHRDVRDVIISAFFHWKFKMDEKFALRTRMSSVLRRGPRFTYHHLRARKTLRDHVKTFCSLGVPELKETVGSWTQNVRAWQHFHQHSRHRSVIVTFDQMREDALAVAKGISTAVGLPDPGDERLVEANERQSLSNLKRYFEIVEDSAHIPFGKKGNLHQLRKGITGDWKAFLTRSMGARIEHHFGELLKELGYENDPRWYQRLDGSSVPFRSNRR